MIFLRYLGYVLFFLLMLVVGLFTSFPFDAAKDRLLEKASKASGMTISAESLEPSWITGVVAKKVKVLPAGAREPIELEEVTARVKLLPFILGKQGFTAELPLAKGTVEADVVVAGDLLDVKGRAKGLELGLVPGLAELTGLPLTGQTDLDVDLQIGTKDPKLTQGQLSLKGVGLNLEKGGKISGFPVPELALGDLDWKIPIEAGKATLKNLKLTGDTLEANVDGTINILNPIGRSTPSVMVSFKPTEKFLKEQPLLGALLTNIQHARGSDGFYSYQIIGTLKSPRPVPKRK